MTDEELLKVNLGATILHWASTLENDGKEVELYGYQIRDLLDRVLRVVRNAKAD